MHWLWSTYGEGILDAQKAWEAEGTERQFDFIHRVWYTGVEDMMEPFISKYQASGAGQIDVSYKYARARLYSVPDPPFFNDELRGGVERFGLRCWMNLRNDDIFSFRWGDPEYVRGFMDNLPPEPTLAGYYMGSDGYVWGREFTSKQPQSPRQLEIDKHAYRFMLWGRMGYDRSLDRAFFEAQLGHRFPQVDAALLYDTWRAASGIIPRVNEAHQLKWDFMWAVEICSELFDGFHSVDKFIAIGPLPGRGILSIPEFVEDPHGRGCRPCNWRTTWTCSRSRR